MILHEALGSSMKRVQHFVYHVWNYVSFLFIKHIWCIYNAMKRIKLIYRFRIGDASSFHMNWLKNFVQRVIKRKLPIDTFIRYFKTLDIKIVLLSLWCFRNTNQKSSRWEINCLRCLCLHFLRLNGDINATDKDII